MTSTHNQMSAMTKGTALRIGSSLALVAMIATTTFGQATTSDNRVVVVHPQPGGTQVPIDGDERVGFAATINLPGRGPVTVLRIDRQPPDPDCVFVTPNGTRIPVKNGEPGTVAGTTKCYQIVVLNTPAGDQYMLITIIKRGNRELGRGRRVLPVGTEKQKPEDGAAESGIIPQPPGAAFFAPDEHPMSEEDEAAILAEMGIIDTPDTQVWEIPSGLTLQFTAMGPPDEVFSQGGPPAGDLNCDGLVSVSDIGFFVQAITDPAGYVADHPECNLLAADINDDLLVTVADIGAFVAVLTGL